jgi:tagaturonate reductase
MKLNKHTISTLVPGKQLMLPSEKALQLPEKVIQFGTGVLLRGLPDMLINDANEAGNFNGRIVMVKSTSNGETDAYAEQDGLYTVAVRGISKSSNISYNKVISSVSRVLNASTDWDEILLCAADPAMQVVISNTTEVGIAMVKDNIHASPPQSFPGKLLAFLYQRFKVFAGARDKGMLVIPTELVPGNGDLLLSILLEQAHIHGLEIAFIDWLENANYFCNSLVDRIVPGKLSAEEQSNNEEELGFQDQLMIMCEPYALWAIEVKEEAAKNILSFAKDNPAVVLAADIEKFRELKLRLLNGSHTFTCGLATLMGFADVKEAMADPTFSGFIESLMKEEIVPAIVADSITKAEAISFADEVLDRYRNPFIAHYWSAICTQISSKMLMRNIPLFHAYIEKTGTVPTMMSLGMAAYILYMKGSDAAEILNRQSPVTYTINDSQAEWYSQAWAKYGSEGIVGAVLGNSGLWGSDLNELPGFAKKVDEQLQLIVSSGISHALEQVQSKNFVNK